MPQTQLHAAYCIPDLLERLDASDAGIVRALLTSLAHFELDATSPLSGDVADPTLVGLLAVSQNLTCRGLPTRAPLAVTEAVLQAAWPADLVFYSEDQRGVGFDLGAVPLEFQALLVRALHITEPRLTAARYSELTNRGQGYPLDSEAEHRFLNDIVATRFGVGVAQTLMPQEPLDRLLRHVPDDTGDVSKALAVPATAPFFAQRVDFALPFPYTPAGMPEAPRGLVLEVDGPHHHRSPQKEKDVARVRAAALAHWPTDRLPVDCLDAPDAYLGYLSEQAEQHPYCQQIGRNYRSPLHAIDGGRCAEQLVLTPILVARVHRALLEAVSTAILRPDAPEWRIGIVERDVPGGHLGVHTFADQLTHLFLLEGHDRLLPRIHLTVYVTPEYAEYALHHGRDVRPLADYRPDSGLDLLLDVAMLSRPFLAPPVLVAGGTARLVIRTTGLALSKRRIATAPLLRYADVCQPDPLDEYLHVPVAGPADALRFFLRELFRKADFRPGQLPILKRGLQAESVLGLLPTGGGKSLTYQLAGLLQPGVSLVVDPIKSLMQDQYEGLLANWIDATSFVNSSVLSTAPVRMERLTGGEVLFFFISPERLQMEQFREQLVAMAHAGVRRIGFSFCVVDEAHCVSEWGHDFRTQYLRLGETARRLCRTHDGHEVPIYGLTATASFDVLADVQRELALPDQEAIVRTRTTRRRELRYRVLRVPAALKHDRIQDLLHRVPGELAEWSAEAATLAELEAPSDGVPLDNARPPRPLPESYDPDSFYQATDAGQYRHAGLIFCPHKSHRIDSGVNRVLSVVQEIDGIQAGRFTGASAEFGAPESVREAEEMMQTQREFITNRLNLLVATKAFGMGIDKPNVRFTVHYCYPSSIESLVQEAGRAGRDRTVALNYLLFDPADEGINESFFNRSFRGQRKEALMLNELLTRVSMPASNRLEQLREAMMEGFPAAVIAPLKNGLWPKEPAPWRLYVNQAFQEAYGYLDLRKPDHLTYNTERRHRSIAPQLAHDVLQRIIQWIRQSAPPEALATTATLVQWLKEESAAFDVPGILPTLEAAPADQRHSTLVIGFANGQASRLVQALGEQGISDAMIWGAAKYAKDDKDFVHKLEREYRKTTSKHLILAKEAAEQLRAGFEKLRDDQDTYKAVHRLTLLGVVADYTLDYGAKTITLCLNRRPDDEREYTERLKQYLNRYTTTAKADELATQAAQRTGSSLLTKLLDALLDFTYGEIADKRRRAAKEMSLACERSLAAPDEDLGEFFDLYFNSKYARAEYLPSDTQAGAYFDRALIWQYLDYMTDPPDGLGKERDNVKHLRGACARMFSTTGAYSNGALLLLDGFALLFLEIERKTVSPKIVAAAADKILQGCYHFREHEHLDDEGLLKFFDEYAARTSTIEPGLASYLGVSIRQTLLLDHYRRWLSVFNSRFDDRPSRAAEQLPDPSTGAAA